MAVEQYREIIQQLILERAERRSALLPRGDAKGERSSASLSPLEEIETQAILDTQRDHYLLLHTGWRGNRRTHGCSLHLDIKDGKIWIQHDGTEVGIATQLLERGVPKDDIVLAFHSPYMRQFTEFAAN